MKTLNGLITNVLIASLLFNGLGKVVAQEAEETPTPGIVEPTIVIEDSPTPTEVVDVGQSEVVVETGNAISYANVINLINSNIVNSNLKFYVVNKFEGEGQNVDLNLLWKETGASEEEKSNFLVIDNKNSAQVDNNVTVIANSGDNNISNINKQALIVTGDSVALANVINLVNNSFVNSEFFVAIVNIDGSLLGDLILPKPQASQNDTNLGPSNNSGSTNDTINTSANSGDNNANVMSNATINTGEAIAISNNKTYVNTSASSGFYLNLNTLGNWNGKIYNFSSPGSVEEANNKSLFLAFSTLNDGTRALNLSENNAIVNNWLMIMANSGNNSIDAESGEIRTGKALAAANLTNLVNMQFVGGKWFWGIINVVGDWKGNAVFAYPDLVVNIKSSKDKIDKNDEFEYLVDYANEGWEDVNNVSMEIELDRDSDYLDDNSGINPIRNGNRIRWVVGALKAKQKKNFRIRVKDVDKNGAFRLVKSVMAYSEEREIVAKIKISTPEVESNSNNNESWTATKVAIHFEENNENNPIGNTSEELPQLEINVKNNVNGFVYISDIVSFEIGVKNTGRKAKDTYLVHQILGSHGEMLTNDELFVGDIGERRDGKIDFGLPMDFDFKDNTKLYSKTWLVGFSEKGTQVESNIAQTQWEVRPKNILTKSKTLKAPSGEVLAAEWKQVPYMAKENLWPYIFLFIGSSMYMWRKGNEIAYLLTSKK